MRPFNRSFNIPSGNPRQFELLKIAFKLRTPGIKLCSNTPANFFVQGKSATETFY